MNSTDPQVIGLYAGALSLVEIGLGSVLHGLKIPLAGTFLSLNQILFLTRLTRLNKNQPDVGTLPFRVSNTTALLKSLSPMGKKLLPMLAISAQGLLFTVGVFLAGPTVMGCCIGAALASLWGVLQPVAVLWLVYGLSFGAEEVSQLIHNFERLMGGLISLTPSSLLTLVSLFAAIKSVLAMLLTALTWNAAFNEQDLVNEKLLQMGLKGFNKFSGAAKTHHPAVGAFKEILRPYFLIPLLITGVTFWFAEHDKAQSVWKLFRLIAVAYLFFLATRLLPVERWIKKVGWGGTALAAALDFIEGKKRDR